MSLAQGNNTPTRRRIEPGSSNPESDALTTRPVRSPKILMNKEILTYDLINSEQPAPGLQLQVLTGRIAPTTPMGSCLVYVKYEPSENINRADIMSLIMRKPAFCICKNKGTDQLCGNHAADQHLCFRFINSTIPLVPKSEFSTL